MPGYAKQSLSDLGGIVSTITVRNVGDSEQLLYTAIKKSAVAGLIAANRSAGTLPVSVYIKKTVSASVSNKALTSNVATLTTSAAHGLFVGDSAIISGVDATFNGTYTVVAVPTATTFTYAKTSSNVAGAAASGSVSATATFYIVKDLRVNNAENKELIERPFVIAASDAIYAISGVDDAFDMVLSIQEGVN